ncbi:hypothetical protein GCE9029_00907 [Grimontia celer]|uniref:Uncharacterized protein n=1 Tax=Grimontia celer TaxID=1796497 RepID=A0A128EWL7_9GAMM|nr:hypothetical protein [Grimontia celer]CZF78545.1 hypothetical protein GCE9029_00907 [Grimontia celer]
MKSEKLELKMISLSRPLVMLVITLFLSACTSGTVTRSFDEITSDFDNEGLFSQMFGWPFQSKVLSVSGMLPVPDLGETCNTSGRRGAFTIFCYNPHKPTYSATFNYLGSDVGTQESHRYLNKLKSLEAEIGAYQNLVVQRALIDVQSEDKKCSRKPEDATKQSADCTQLNSKYTDLDEKIEALAESINQMQVDNGVIAYTWEAKSSGGGSATASENNKGVVDLSKGISGYALLHGIRIKTLVIGNDFNDMYSEMSGGWYPKQLKMPTTIIQARHIVYGSVENVNAIIEAAVKASDVKGVKIKDIEAKVNLALRRVLSNRGALSLISYERKRLNRYGEGELNGTSGQELPFLTTYAVFTNLTDLFDSAPSKMF